jgi:cell division protein ZapD
VSIEAGEICFEQPLNEHVRTFLRLDCLFGQLQHYLLDESVAGRRAAMATLLDILTLLTRSDLRTEFIKELNHQHLNLSRLQNRPGIDHGRLGQILQQLQQLNEALQNVPAQAAGTLLKENEFLSGIISRSAIPGGCCGFDLPAYHRWLGQTAEQQRHDLERWCRDTKPFQDTAALMVKLVRESARPVPKLAERGMYIHTMEGPCQLIRVLLPAGTPLYPEISAGKHRCTIRFMEHRDVNRRPAQTAEDVSFDLVLCAL